MPNQIHNPSGMQVIEALYPHRYVPRVPISIWTVGEVPMWIVELLAGDPRNSAEAWQVIDEPNYNRWVSDRMAA